MKVSLISTVKNEEESIEDFLDSLLSQSRKPDEIIIVDGDSTDNTVKIINEYIQKGAPIKLIIKEGANISMGRNTAVKNSKYDIIASTDAGCKIDKDWLKNLIEKFDNETDVVCGMTIPDPKTDFEKCVADVTCYKVEEVDEETFLPSSRSVAFRKSAWEKVGGYQELCLSDDTLFDLNLKKAGCKFKVARNAIVYWKMRKNLREVFKQYYLYGKYQRDAGLATTKNILVHIFRSFWPVGIFILFFILLLYFNAIQLLLVLVAITFLLFFIQGLEGGLKCYRINRRVKFLMTGIIIKIVVSMAWTLGELFNRSKAPKVGTK